MIIDREQVEAAVKRYEERTRHRERNERLMKEQPFAVDTPERVEKFLRHHGFGENVVRTVLANGGRLTASATTGSEAGAVPGVLERVLGTNDLMSVFFLEQGLSISRSVCRIWIRSGTELVGYGTGFMISPRILLTNHHVLGDIDLARGSIAEFDFQRGGDGSLAPTTTFGLDVNALHIADKHLDYALVAVNPTAASGRKVSDFGWNVLLPQEGKAVAAQFVNIVQHPNGEVKQLSLRENRVVDVLEQFLHYVADTAPGSSGSPVYNDRWEVVALHHSGVPATNAAGQTLAIDGQVWRPDMGEDRVKWIANEGVRISSLVAHVKAQATGSQRQLIDEALAVGPSPVFPRPGTGTGTTVPVVGSSGGGEYTTTVAQDGTATWTIPLKVSVQLGCANLGGVPQNVAPAPPLVPDASVPPPQPSSPSHEAIVEEARRELGPRGDVLAIRLGYVFRNGWITSERALVVTVRQRRSEASLRTESVSPLPDTFRGLPVEVTTPTIEQVVRHERGPAAAEAVFRSISVVREEILYQPPAGAELEPVTADMRVVAHVSPDAGWSQLKTFLEGSKKSLVVGMYDFGAPHIVDAVSELAKKAGFKMKLVMQRGESVGSGTKKDDFKDAEVVEQLQQAFGGDFSNAWVKIGRVNGWVASSYHIKVAVRDGKAFWLSSGNWQSSNQPDADPLGEDPPKRSWLTKYNRDWHAIVEHPGLAKTYQAFLENDLDENLKLGGGDELTLPDLLVPEALLVPLVEERAAAFKYFAPFDKTRQFEVEPLLSPDNYRARVLKLIKSAKQELFIQNQTFNAPGENHAQLQELIDAVLERQQSGVDVRIIFRVLFAPAARENLEGLRDLGFDMDTIKVQQNCHTKGIIVDGKQVLLGSQNLSNDGVSVNRDASLLFTDSELADYFRTIFLHDWNNLAKQDIGNESRSFELATADQATPDGMVRLTWKDYMEML